MMLTLAKQESAAVNSELAQSMFVINWAICLPLRNASTSNYAEISIDLQKKI